MNQPWINQNPWMIIFLHVLEYTSIRVLHKYNFHPIFPLLMVWDFFLIFIMNKFQIGPNSWCYNVINHDVKFENLSTFLLPYQAILFLSFHWNIIFNANNFKFVKESKIFNLSWGSPEVHLKVWTEFYFGGSILLDWVQVPAPKM